LRSIDTTELINSAGKDRVIEK